MDVSRCQDQMESLYGLYASLPDIDEPETDDDDVVVDDLPHGGLVKRNGRWLAPLDLHRTGLIPGRRPYSFDLGKAVEQFKQSLGEAFQDFNADNQLAKSVRRGRGRNADQANSLALVE